MRIAIFIPAIFPRDDIFTVHKIISGVTESGKATPVPKKDSFNSQKPMKMITKISVSIRNE
jgi:argonaute-like protein implicated in RNA metabolism and viral defense